MTENYSQQTREKMQKSSDLWKSLDGNVFSQTHFDKSPFHIETYGNMDISRTSLEKISNNERIL